MRSDVTMDARDASDAIILTVIFNVNGIYRSKQHEVLMLMHSVRMRTAYISCCRKLYGKTLKTTFFLLFLSVLNVKNRSWKLELVIARFRNILAHLAQGQVL